MGAYVGTQTFIANNPKSRNVNPGTFKTAVSIGSTKGVGKNL